MKNLPFPPGDASLLAQLLLARGDPDALGAGGETVPWTWPDLAKMVISWDLNGIIVIV